MSKLQLLPSDKRARPEFNLKRPNILLAIHKDLREPLLDYFWSRVGDDVVFLPLPQSDPLNEGEIEAFLPDTDILVTSWRTPPLPARLEQLAPRLSLICHAAGTVRTLIGNWTPTDNIRLASAADALGQGVGEFTFTMALMAAKGVPWYGKSLRQGFWKEWTSSFCTPFELEGEHVGLIGLGSSGRAFASLAVRAGAKVSAFDPYCPKAVFDKLGVTQSSSIEILFQRSRIVSLHAANLPGNKGMINASHFHLMRRGAIFINTARADLVTETDLIAAAAKSEAVFCLDVMWREPIEVDHPLRQMPNVLLTPHIAGATHENRRRLGRFVAEQIQAYLAGTAIPGEILPHHFAYLA